MRVHWLRTLLQLTRWVSVLPGTQEEQPEPEASYLLVSEEEGPARPEDRWGSVGSESGEDSRKGRADTALWDHDCPRAAGGPGMGPRLYYPRQVLEAVTFLAL